MSKKALLEAKTLVFNEIMGNGKIYKVPLFQRDYSWNQDNWEDLWNDIMDSYAENEPHYMGAIVLQNIGDNVFNIIDGQQRFTTINIINLAIISKIKELAKNEIDKEANEERANLLINDYLGRKDPASLKYSSKLFLNENNDAFYQQRLLNFREPINYTKLIDSDKLLWDAYLFFLKRVDELFENLNTGEKLASFLKERVGGALLFIQVIVEDELNAFKVFETLNSRRVELTSTDLLKNYLFTLVAKSRTDLDHVKSHWKRIVEVIGLKRFPIFLRDYLNGQLKLISKDQLFKAIKNKVKSDQDVFDLLENLEKSAYIYVALENPNDEFWKGEKETVQLITALKLFGVAQNKSILMIAHSKLGNVGEFKRLLKVIVNISFRYNIIGCLPINEMEKVYNKVSVMIYNAKSVAIKDILASIKKLYVEDDSFKSYFEMRTLNTNNSTNKKLVRYILYKLEGQLPNGVKYDYSTDSGTIEHILPENLTEEWEAFFNEEEHNRNVYKIGNLTLLESKKNNRKAADYTIDVKLPVFQSSKYNLTNSINVSEWNISAIKNRQIDMAKIACGVWKVQF